MVDLLTAPGSSRSVIPMGDPRRPSDDDLWHRPRCGENFVAGGLEVPPLRNLRCCGGDLVAETRVPGRAPPTNCEWQQWAIPAPRESARKVPPAGCCRDVRAQLPGPVRLGYCPVGILPTIALLTPETVLPHRSLGVTPQWRRAGYRVCGRPSHLTPDGSPCSSESEVFMLGRSPSPDSCRVESYYSASPVAAGARSDSGCSLVEHDAPSCDDEFRSEPLSAVGQRNARSPSRDGVAHSVERDASDAETDDEKCAVNPPSEIDPLTPHRDSLFSCDSGEEPRTVGSWRPQSPSMDGPSPGNSCDECETLYDTYPPMASGSASQ